MTLLHIYTHINRTNFYNSVNINFHYLTDLIFRLYIYIYIYIYI